ncbi:MAG: NfeD family protein [Prochloraceae cyanobacterium]
MPSINDLSSPVIIWLIIGSILCCTELIVPTAFTSFILGLSAIIVAAISLAIPQLSLQIAIWMAISLILVIGSRRLLPKQKKNLNLDDDRTGETLSAIVPGKGGRVLYEGGSWQAKNEYEELTIPEGEKVYVIRKQGNTLIVLPQKLVD